jgi:integrase
MAQTNLSPAFIARAEAESGAERTIYWDDDLSGFGLMVTANDAKSFVVQYRANGRSRRMTLKANLKLGEARKEAKAILGKVAKGHDPLGEKRKDQAAAENTLRSVCENYFRREGKKLRTASDREKTLVRLVYPKLGARQIEDIRRSEIVRLLDNIEDDRGPVMADRTLAYLRKVFNWQASRSDEFRSPIVRGMARTKPAELARDRVLTDDELRKVWRAAADMKNAFGPFVRFVLLTATRRDEAANMVRSELDGDLWVIPAARYKGKHDHAVPLSKAARAVLQAVPVINNGDLVFTHDGRRPLGGFSKFKARLDQVSGVKDWTLHDLRRTARSLMSRAGVPSDYAERCLGHVINGVRGVYDRHEYQAEKAAAFEKLAQLVADITA